MWNPRARLDEDCLYVSIWSPAIEALHLDVAGGSSTSSSSSSSSRSSSSCTAPASARRAVLVWVHGGGYETGGSSVDVYDGSALAAAGNVLVVSVQYRLGALGFLYVGARAYEMTVLYTVQYSILYLRAELEPQIYYKSE